MYMQTHKLELKRPDWTAAEIGSVGTEHTILLATQNVPLHALAWSSINLKSCLLLRAS